MIRKEVVVSTGEAKETADRLRDAFDVLHAWMMLNAYDLPKGTLARANAQKLTKMFSELKELGSAAFASHEDVQRTLSHILESLSDEEVTTIRRKVS